MKHLYCLLFGHRYEIDDTDWWNALTPCRRCGHGRLLKITRLT